MSVLILIWCMALGVPISHADDPTLVIRGERESSFGKEFAEIRFGSQQAEWKINSNFLTRPNNKNQSVELGTFSTPINELLKLDRDEAELIFKKISKNPKSSSSRNLSHEVHLWLNNIPVETTSVEGRVLLQIFDKIRQRTTWNSKESVSVFKSGNQIRARGKNVAESILNCADIGTGLRCPVNQIGWAYFQYAEVSK